MLKLPQIKSDLKKRGLLKYIKGANDERALLAGYTIDESKGRHVCAFFESFLKLTEAEWAGQSVKLMDWQRNDLLMPLFSWKRPDGTRRFRRASIWIPKKQGKSLTASGIALYGLCGDNEPGAKVYCIANDRAQAGIVFDECANMVDASPTLAKSLKVLRSTKHIVKDHQSYIEALSADAKTAEGLKAHVWVIDELHAFDSRGRLLRDAVRFAGRNRRQPLEFIISTAGDECAGIGREEWENAVEIRDGKEDLHTFALIYAADPDDDWTSPKVWRKAMPSLGTTVKESAIEEDCKAAIQSPRLQNTFKRYTLNIWTGAEAAALPMIKWKKCGRHINDSDLEGLPCWGAFDLSATLDMTAFVLCFRRDAEGEAERPSYIIRPTLWLPSENIIERERQDRMQYRALSEQGWLHLTPGASISYADVQMEIERLCGIFNPREIGFDPWNARKFAEDVAESTGITMIEIPQSTAYLTAACKEFEASVHDFRIEHPDNPILTKMASDLAWKTDPNGNIRPIKNDSQKRRRRIDGIVASIMAISRAMLGQGTSVYNDRELVVI